MNLDKEVPLSPRKPPALNDDADDCISKQSRFRSPCLSSRSESTASARKSSSSQPAKFDEEEPSWTIEQVEQTILEMENAQNSRNVTTIADLLVQYTKLRELDNQLIRWLIKFTHCEREATNSTNTTTRYKPSKEERARRNIITRFYLSFVPFLQTYFQQEHDSGDPFDVVVSHSGEEKKEYAHPLADFLRENGCERVFCETFGPSNKPKKEMLRALVTCKVCWCVVTPSFLVREWPRRELLIARTRFVLEDPGFIFIWDCYQKILHRGSDWMDQLMAMEALKLCDSVGREIDDQWPSKMQPSQPRETHKERFKRIAKEFRVTPVARNENPITKLHPRNPTWSVSQHIKNSREIDFIDTWIPDLGHFESDLILAINQNDAKVRIFLLDVHVEREVAKARSAAIHNIQSDDMSDYDQDTLDSVLIGVKTNLKTIHRIQEALSAARKQNLEVWFYRSMPSVPLVRADGKFYMGVYFHGDQARTFPFFEFDLVKDELLWKRFVGEFTAARRLSRLSDPMATEIDKLRTPCSVKLARFTVGLTIGCTLTLAVASTLLFLQPNRHLS